MRVAFVTPYDAADVSWMSGTGYHISQSLMKGGLDLHFIGPLKRQYHPVNIARYAVNRLVLGKNDHPQRDPGFLKHYARQVERQLKDSGAEVVFGSGGHPLCYLQTDLPIVVWTDCTFANLLDYYGKYSNLSARTIRNGHAADRSLYQRCTRGIFTSDWAAQSAINDYGLPPERAAIISRGANVPDERSEADINNLIDSRPTDRCVLLLVGVDWHRKGGDIAVAAAKALNARGLPTELRVVGVEPVIEGDIPDFVKPYGRISKSTPEGVARFATLLSEAHILIVPTRAEAYGIVYLEASAFGVPSLATRTGGVPSAVREGVTGRLFDLEAPGADYADVIEQLLNDHQAYRYLALQAYHDYRQRTNWTTVAARVIEVIRAVADEGPRCKE